MAEIVSCLEIQMNSISPPKLIHRETSPFGLDGTSLCGLDAASPFGLDGTSLPPMCIILLIQGIEPTPLAIEGKIWAKIPKSAISRTRGELDGDHG